MYKPRGAAQWLAKRLGRSISRETVQTYIETGDLIAVNASEGENRAHWIVTEDALEQFIAQIGPDGKLPTPTGGWPQYVYPEGKTRNRKKANDPPAFAR